jgi:hypothetical protein
MTDTHVELWLLFFALAAWAFGALLQWRNIRRQEKILDGLQHLRLRASGKAARGKAPRLPQLAAPRDQIMPRASRLAG